MIFNVKNKSAAKDMKSVKKRIVSNKFKKSLKKLLSKKEEPVILYVNQNMVMNQARTINLQLKAAPPTHLMDFYEVFRRIIINSNELYNEFEFEYGIFAKANFKVKNKNKNIKILVKNASLKAKSLLIDSEEILKARLKSHSLSLSEIKFVNEA